MVVLLDWFVACRLLYQSKLYFYEVFFFIFRYQAWQYTLLQQAHSHSSPVRLLLQVRFVIWDIWERKREEDGGAYASNLHRVHVPPLPEVVINCRSIDEAVLTLQSLPRRRGWRTFGWCGNPHFGQVGGKSKNLLCLQLNIFLARMRLFTASHF